MDWQWIHGHEDPLSQKVFLTSESMHGGEAASPPGFAAVQGTRTCWRQWLG